MLLGLAQLGPSSDTAALVPLAVAYALAVLATIAIRGPVAERFDDARMPW
jgi:hypothetical protein